jgi:hypothetical protein
MSKQHNHVPPQDLGAEMATLASMALDRDVLPKILQSITSHCFYRLDHRLIFDSLTGLHESGKPVDVRLLRDELERRGYLEKAGGVKYLTELLNSVPSAANGMYYAEIVREKSNRRKLIELGNQLVKTGYSNELLNGQLLDHADTLKSLSQGLSGKAVTVQLSEVEPQSVGWLWKDRIPSGKYTCIAGDPGLGKSFIGLYLAAVVSTGRAWADDASGAPELGSVVILSAEDDVADTIVPRLQRMDADLSRIHTLEAVRRGGKDCHFDLGLDLLALDEAMDADCRLVIIDPLSAYMGKIDGHSNNDVRGLLAPLIKLAQRRNVAIVGINHLNKSGGTNAVYRVMGSLAIAAAARAVWHVTKDRNDETLRYFLPGKQNLAPEDGMGLSYRIVDGVIFWDEQSVNMTADCFLNAEAEQQRATATTDAKLWLTELLSEHGPTWTEDIKAEANGTDHTWRTIERAKKDLGPLVQAERKGFGKGAKWYWRLDDQKGMPGELGQEVSDVK